MYVLHADLGRFEAEHPEHAEGVGEHRTTALHAVVDVPCAVLGRIDVYGSGHTAGNRLLVEHGDLEEIWMLAEGVRGGHAGRPSADNADTLGLGGLGGRHDSGREER